MSSQSNFLVFKLPLLALESVLRNSDLCDLIHFSFISVRCRKLIKQVKIRIDGLDVRVDEKHTGLYFMIGHKRYGGWGFNFRDFEQKGMETEITTTIGEIAHRSFIEKGFIYSFIEGDMAVCIEATIQYLNELFGCKVFMYALLPDNIPQSRYPLFVKYHNCRSFIIKGKNNVNNEELKKILDEIHTSQITFLDVPLGESFEHDIRLWAQPKHIHVWRDAYWITSEMFINSKCTRMLLRDCKLTTDDCRSFVKQWYTSSDKSFKSLAMQWKNGPPQDLNFEGLGFELMTFNPERRHRAHRYYSNKAYNISSGLDFERSDGLLATVAILPHVFFFCVWHKRFPNMVGIQIGNDQ